MTLPVVTHVNGTAESLTRELELGDRVVAVCEFKINSAHAAKPAEDPKLHQTLTLMDLYETDDATELLRKMRGEHRAKDDEKKGRKAIAAFTEQPAFYTDESGVVMTPNEIAEARGVSWNDGQEFTILFANGARALWPDDFYGQTLAAPGGTMMVPGDGAPDRQQVVAYLDAEGFEIDKWDEEDAAALEQWHAEHEAAADAEAMLALELGRTTIANVDGTSTPLDKVPARQAVAHVKTITDKTWLAQALHDERGSKKPRPTVLKALLAAIGEDPEGAE